MLSHFGTVFFILAASSVSADIKPAVVDTGATLPQVILPGPGPTPVPITQPGQPGRAPPILPPKPGAPGKGGPTKLPPVPGQLQRVPGQPIKYLAPPGHPGGAKDAGNMPPGGSPPGGQSPLQQLLQRPEMVGGGNSSPNSDSGTQNSLDYGNGPGMNGRPGEGQVCINGCATEPGKFKTIYGSPPNPNCDRCLVAGRDLAEFIDMHFARCVKQAVGTTGDLAGGKIYHAGVIGDARHQASTSLHNEGRAIDVKAIEVNGTTYVYGSRDPQMEQFFRNLRQCWSDAAQSYRGCSLTPTGNGTVGSLGKEYNAAHAGHVHLSLPTCGRALTWWWDWFLGSSAWAAEPEIYEPPPDKISTKTVPLKKGSEAKLTVTDTNGEPAGSGIFVDVAVRCKGTSDFKTVATTIEGCEYEKATFNAKTNTLEVQYLTSVLADDGFLYCKLRKRQKIRIKCK